MKFEDHCKESIILFGKDYAAVHLWLDEFAGKPGIGMRHRKFRHHAKGLMEVSRIFGPNAVKAAYRHIVSDLMMEGWKETDPFPKDEIDYVKLGLF